MPIKPMEAALAKATLAARAGEVPVGAVIIFLPTGELVAACHNEVEQQKNPTAHAEILAIMAACQHAGSKFLHDYAIYVTLEPCAMCAQALAHARIGRVYYGASDAKGGAVEHGARVFHQPTCHHRPEIYAGIMEKECGAILKEFFQSKR